MLIDGILLLYRHPFHRAASTIMEHVNSFERYSKFKVWKVNTECGFPRDLGRMTFRVIVLHYSLFGTAYYSIGGRFLEYLRDSKCSYKIAFFQDEHQHCQKRFSFIKRYGIDCIYTLVEPAYFKYVYQKYTQVPKIIYNLAGYVSDDLVRAAEIFSRPDRERAIDIGYRSRELPFYMGKGAREKTIIAEESLKRAKEVKLRLDIETREKKRIYQEDWYKFIGNCKAVLGVEAGVSIFDVEDVVFKECSRLIRINPKISFEQVSEILLNKWEGNIPYRTISPRHFEAAALRTTQILFEGDYSGILKPMIHYIPLKKDFSNFDDVIKLFEDESLRHELCENTYRDLIASGSYSYERFINGFDQELLKSGYCCTMTEEKASEVTGLLSRGNCFRNLKVHLKRVLYLKFPGRKIVVDLWRCVQEMFKGKSAI